MRASALVLTESELVRNSQLILAISLMPAVVSLAACAGKIRYPSYYTLNLPNAVPAANHPAPTLGAVAVQDFDAPGFLRGGPIAYRESATSLGFYAYHRWAVDPRRVVTVAVIHEMQSRGIFRSVDLFDGRGMPDCLMTGAIDHLEEIDEGTNVSVEVGLSAQLINLKTGEVLWQGNSAKRTKLDQRSVPGVVAAMSAQMNNTVESLVSSIQNRVSTATAPLSGSHIEQ
jgi:ABC-type uncharacterized transport system auxiliary subunit